MRSYLKFIEKHKWFVLLASIAFSTLMFFSAKQLSVKPDFLQLLPENFRSVKAFHHITKLMGGVGSLILVVESSNRDVNIEYLDAFYNKAKDLKTIKYIDYKRPLKFIEQNGILWLPKKMLEDMYSDLKRRIDYERQKLTSLLPDELGPPPPLRTKVILKELEHRAGKTPYYENKDGSLMIAIIKPSQDSNDLAFVEHLMQDVRGVTKSLESTFPQVKWDFTGLYLQKLEQIHSMKRDIRVAGIFTVVGITLILLLFFRSPKALVITIVPLLIGILWTMGLTNMVIGYVNIVSGFFLSALMGLGIDYSLQIFSRYREEFFREDDTVSAIEQSFLTTGKGTLFGALTTLGVFLILIISNFRAFRETGILSSLGILSIFISLALHLPLLIFILKPRFRLFQLTDAAKPSRFYLWKEMLLIKHPGKILIGGVILIVVSFAVMKYNHYEYDMRKLENKSLPSVKLMDKLQKIFKADFSPAIALGYSLDELASLRQQITELAKNPDNLIVDHRSILDYYPYPESNLRYRLFLVRKIRDMLLKNFDNFNPADKKLIRPYIKYLYPHRVPLEQYPPQIRLAFVGNDAGRPAYFYYIYPPSNLGMGEKAFRFAETLKKIKVRDESSVASDSILIKEIILLIVKDGEYLLPLVLVSIVLLVFILFRKVSYTLMVLLPLVTGSIYLAGFLGFSNILANEGIALNHLNVIMIPVLLGVGIDYGIHIFHRLQDEFKQTHDAKLALKRIYETSKALFISGATTVVGFMSFFLAGYKGFRGMAWLAVPGMTFIFLSAVLILPALYLKLRMHEKIYPPIKPSTSKK